MKILYNLYKRQILVVFCIFLLIIVPNTKAQTDEGEGGTADPGESPTTQAKKSDSPFLQLPIELRDYAIKEPDNRHGSLVADPTAVETYNVSTGENLVIPSTDFSQLPQNNVDRVTPAYTGLLPNLYFDQGDLNRSVIGTDDRVRINGTASYPWRTIVKLYVNWPNGSGSGCSGSLIDAYHVLTAGHCVFSSANGGWASSIQVVPGLDDTYMPYNSAWATYMRSYTGWTQNSDSRHDWGMLTLDRNIGDFTGWMGRITADSSDGMYTGVANVAGYPGATPASDPCPTFAACMYFDADSGHSADDYNHWYSMDTAGGMSGGPVWRYISDPASRHIMSIHTCGTGGCGITSNSVNHGTRLNNDKYDRIVTWIGDDTPPTDRADLIDDGQSWSGFTPTTITGGDNFHVWSDVRNIGTLASGSFNVSYYASTNTFISTSDYLIGSDAISSIGPFNWADSDWNNVFPGSIPNGTYYVGWIIDSGGVVSEFVESNNTAYKSSYQLTVNTSCSAPTAVTDLVASINGNFVDLNWSATGADEYEIHRKADDFYFTSSAGTLLATLPGTSFTDTDLAANVLGDVDNNYSYVVIANNTCGGGSASAISNRVGEFDFWLSGSVPTTDTDNDRLLDAYETNTGVYVSPTNTGTDPNNADTDGDSIDDGDEVLGTLAGLNLPGMGTNPLRQDILLEYDWFDDALDCSAHSHRPTLAALTAVTNAFANAPTNNPDGSTGINFIHDYGQGGLFTGGNFINDANGVIAGGVNGAEFQAHKTANFAANRHGYFHYVLNPHRYNTTSGSSGQAELPGDDLVVSLQCYLSTNNVANTIVHELGHNLNLRHGGDENCNYKPNYNSVMNYKYQFPGVDNNCTPLADGVLNYSIGDRITLNENNLNENNGVCGAGFPWDWNGNSSFESAISWDINSSGNSTCGGTLTTLNDHNDWANIVLSGLTDGDGNLPFAQEIITEQPVPLAFQN